jgi:hypothetical protein
LARAAAAARAERCPDFSSSHEQFFHAALFFVYN